MFQVLADHLCNGPMLRGLQYYCTCSISVIGELGMVGESA